MYDSFQVGQLHPKKDYMKRVCNFKETICFIIIIIICFRQV
jgi:hypothetical protein